MWATQRANSECASRHGAASVAHDVIVTNITWDATNTYDDRRFNCTLP